MTQNLLNETRMQMKVNRRNEPQLGAPPERILREIAFVLKMTQRVREQVEVGHQEEELVEV